MYVADDRGIVVRDLASGQEVRLGNAPKGTIWGAWFSPDCKGVAALPERGDVPVWRIDRPAAPEFHLKGHTGHVQWLDYTADDGWRPAAPTAPCASGARPVGIAVMRGHGTRSRPWCLRRRDPGPQHERRRDPAPLGRAEGAQRRTSVRRGQAQGRRAEQRWEDRDLDEGDMVRVYRCEICGSVDQVRALALSKSPRPLNEAEQRQFRAAAG